MDRTSYLLLSLLLVLLAGCVTEGGTRDTTGGIRATAPKDAEVAQDATAPAPMAAEEREALDTLLEVMRSGEWSVALNMAEELVGNYPLLAEGYANLGNIQWQLEANNKAEQAWRKALELRPGWPAVANQLGIFYRQLGRFAEALEMYQLALKGDEGYADAHRNIAILYELYMGEGEKALQHYRRYRELLGADEREVTMWIADLERRVGGSAQ
jgi:tetratricopeptide (TPR) repeat protein